MEIIGHAIVFFFSSFAGYVVVKTPGNWLYYALFWGLFAGGVYLLGWWALLSCLFGIAFGGYLSRLLAGGQIAQIGEKSTGLTKNEKQE